MKIIPVLATILLSLSAIGQKSYYFSDPLPTEGTVVTNIDKKWYGKFKQENASRTIIINEDGIFVQSTNVSSVSRELIRESSTYDVRNGYIFGVAKDDSLPCILEGERYYFGIRNTEQIVGAGSSNILIKSSKEANTFYLNMEENGYYLPVRLTFERGNLIMAYFDYELDGSEFDFVENQKSIKTDFHEIVILTPTSEELSRLISDGVFSDIKKHKKTR